MLYLKNKGEKKNPHTKNPTPKPQTSEADSVSRQQSRVLNSDRSSPQDKVPAGLPCSGSVLTTPQLRREQCPGLLEREPNAASAAAKWKNKAKEGKEGNIPSFNMRRPKSTAQGHKSQHPESPFPVQKYKDVPAMAMGRKDRQPVQLMRGEGAGQGGIAEKP